MLINRLAITGIALAALAVGPALAQAPAVSQFNGKFSGEGGVSGVDGHSGATGLAQGSLSVPLGSSFGFQADGGVGAMNGGLAWGAGGHLFWRDPATGLLGLTAKHSQTDHFGWTRAGAEGEFYLGQFTLSARGGYQWGHDSHRIKIDSGIYGGADAKIYLSENFMMTAGGGIFAGDWLARGGVELQPGLFNMSNLALFAKGEVGEHNAYRATAGVRFYFGAAKSLVRRHREDDPDANLFDEQTGEKKDRRCIRREQLETIDKIRFCNFDPV